MGLCDELRKEADRIEACMHNSDYALRTYAEHINAAELMRKAAARIEKCDEE